MIKDDTVIITGGEYKGSHGTVAHVLKKKPYTRIKVARKEQTYFGSDWSITIISVLNKHVEVITKETHPELYI